MESARRHERSSKQRFFGGAGVISLAIALLAIAPAAALAANPTIRVSGTTLIYAGDSHKNDVNVSLTGSDYTITDTGNSVTALVESDGPGGCTNVTTTATCPATGITAITATGDDNDDTIEIDPSVTVGADVAGEGGLDDLLGGSGGDTLDGGSAKDTLTGGGGDDHLLGGVAVDTLSGGYGDDYLEGGDSTDDLDGGANDDHLDGGDSDDTLSGGDGNDLLDGGLDNDSDTVTGGPGVDLVDYSRRTAPVVLFVGASCGEVGEGDSCAVEGGIGGSGNDTLNGSIEPDMLFGGPGADVLHGNTGTDLLSGGNDGAPDTLDGGLDLDTADYSDHTAPVTVDLSAAGGDGAAGENDDVQTENVLGGSAGDTLLGDSNVNALDGGGGADSLDGRGGADALLGGAGPDTSSYAARSAAIDATVDGNANDGEPGEYDYVETENVVGGTGDDSLTGDGGANALGGGDGADTINGGDGADTIDGGPGNDPTLEGGGGGDSVSGGAGNDNLSGGEGIDALDGNGDDDSLDGGSGADSLLGGSGRDLVDYSYRLAALVITADASADDGSAGEGDNVGTDVEDLNGGDGGDRMVANGDAGTVNGNGGNDSLDGGGGPDTLDGGAGIDRAVYAMRSSGVSVSLNDANDDGAPGEGDNATATIEELQGGSGGDTLTGDGGANSVIGSGGNDTLRGGGGIDTLSGGSGNDDLSGNDGDDTLTGDEGDDSFRGDAGADSFNGGPGTDAVLYDDRSAAVTITLDGAADDGAAGEGDNARTDIENAVGGSGGDLISGSTAVNVLSGGAGNDQIASSDSVGDSDLCGAGDDTVTVDSSDTVAADCEHKTVQIVTAPSIAIFGLTSKMSKKGVVPVEIACGRGSLGTCTGSVELVAKKSLGRASISIAAGEAAIVKVRLSKKARKTVMAKPRLRVKVNAIARDDSGATKTASRTISLVRPAKKAKR